MKLTYELLENIIVPALEGGSNYWYYLPDPPKRKKNDEFNDDPLSIRIAKELWFNENYQLQVTDVENPDEHLGYVTKESMQKALDKALVDFPHAMANFISGDYDADDADIIFQLATMGDVAYG